MKSSLIKLKCKYERKIKTCGILSKKLLYMWMKTSTDGRKWGQGNTKGDNGWCFSLTFEDTKIKV